MKTAYYVSMSAASPQVCVHGTRKIVQSLLNLNLGTRIGRKVNQLERHRQGYTRKEQQRLPETVL